MRILVLALLVGCTRAGPPQDPPPLPPADATVDKPGPRLLDAALPLDASPVAPVPATEVKPLAMAGPYPSLEASCHSIPPCGFTALDPNLGQINPATVTDCRSVLDPSIDAVGRLPPSIDRNQQRKADLVHAITGGELRLGGIECTIPKGARGDRTMHYAFVHRADGWWRTAAPVFEQSYNEKYCAGWLYVLWNTKGTRTIAGIAAAVGCLTCGKQGNDEHALEMMLRIDVGGDRPAVFSPLGVGLRTRVVNDGPSANQNDVDCKPGSSATSVKERWLADDEVELASPSAATGGPLTTPIKLRPNIADGMALLARSGRYKFAR